MKHFVTVSYFVNGFPLFDISDLNRSITKDEVKDAVFLQNVENRSSTTEYQVKFYEIIHV